MTQHGCVGSSRQSLASQRSQESPWSVQSGRSNSICSRRSHTWRTSQSTFVKTMSKTEKNTCPQLWEATIRADLTAEAESGMIPSFQRSWLNKPDSPKSSSLSIEAKLMGLPAEEEKKVEQEQSIFC
eukprot:1873958-Rhodomonas_salina.2